MALDFALQEDVPRILRADMTQLARLGVTYRGITAQHAADHIRERGARIGELAAALREELRELLGEIAEEPGHVAYGEEPAAPAGPPEYSSKTLLSGILVGLRLVSSTGVARRGFRAGAIMVDGEVVPEDRVLSPGEHVIESGEVSAMVRIT